MNTMEQMNSGENSGLLESLKQKMRKLQTVVLLATSMFAAQETFGQNTAEEASTLNTVLGNAKKVELAGTGVENINKLHHSIDSLLEVLQEQVLRNDSTKEIDLSVYGYKPKRLKDAHLYSYKDVTIGTGDVVSFDFTNNESEQFSYGSNKEDNCSLMKYNKDTKTESKTIIYNESKGLHAIESEGDSIDENTAPDFEKDLQEIKNEVQKVIDETK